MQNKPTTRRKPGPKPGTINNPAGRPRLASGDGRPYRLSIRASERTYRVLKEFDGSMNDAVEYYANLQIYKEI